MLDSKGRKEGVLGRDVHTHPPRELVSCGSHGLCRGCVLTSRRVSGPPCQGRQADRDQGERVTRCVSSQQLPRALAWVSTPRPLPQSLWERQGVSCCELLHARACYFKSPKAESLRTVNHILFVSKSAFLSLSKNCFWLASVFFWASGNFPGDDRF